MPGEQQTYGDHGRDRNPGTDNNTLNNIVFPSVLRPQILLEPIQRKGRLSPGTSHPGREGRTLQSLLPPALILKAAKASRVTKRTPATTATASPRRSTRSRAAQAVPPVSPPCAVRETTAARPQRGRAATEPAPAPVRGNARTTGKKKSAEQVAGLSSPNVTTRAGAKRQRQVEQAVAPPALDLSTSPVAGRPSRPRALDFWDSPATPSAPAPTRTRGSTRKVTNRPPLTPQIPWELYDIHEEPQAGSTTQEAARTDVKKGKNTRADMDRNRGRKKPSGKKAAKPKLATGVSQQNAGSNQEHQISPLITYSGEESDDSDGKQDAHDKEMDEDYIPVGPGPMPRVPKILKGPRKRQKKAQSAKDRVGIETQDALNSKTAADTSPPTRVKPKRQQKVAAPAKPTSPPSLSVTRPESSPPLAAPEADPMIWSLGRKQAPRHSKRDAPARAGNVYCEVCFRDDCARWIRIRDGAIRLLRLLGGDVALQQLRELARFVADAEEAEEESLAHQHSLKHQGRPRKRLRSPPPPEVQPSSSGSDSDGRDAAEAHGRKGKVSAKKLLILPDGDTLHTRSLRDNPPDVVGLVLLRILAERPTPRLDRAQKAEVTRTIEALRKDIGLSVKQLCTLSANCRALLVSFPRIRSDTGGRLGTTVPGGGRTTRASAASWWFWEFDQALQEAHRQLPAEGEGPNAPSAFAAILAKKVREAEAELASVMAKAQADDALDHNYKNGPGLRNLAALERALGCDIPSDAFLKRVGDKLERARWALAYSRSLSLRPTTAGGNKRRRDEEEYRPTTAAGPATKRHKPTARPPATTPQSGPRRPTSLVRSNPPSPSSSASYSPSPTSSSSSQTSPSLHPPPARKVAPLPCTYCAESDAFLRRVAQRPYPRGGGANTAATGAEAGTRTRTGTGTTASDKQKSSKNAPPWAAIRRGRRRDDDGDSYRCDDEDNDDGTRPWIKPLMWSFGYSHRAAARVRSAGEFVQVVRRERGGMMVAVWGGADEEQGEEERGVREMEGEGGGEEEEKEEEEEARGGGGHGRTGKEEGGGGEEEGEEQGRGRPVIKFLVDVSGEFAGIKGAAEEEVEDGGEGRESRVRVVLIEMRSVFEAIWGGKRTDADSGRRKVRFEAPVMVGVWEKWKEGEMEGARYL